MATTPSELKSAFERGDLSRDDYWQEMQKMHASLSHYCELVEQSELERIEIRGSGLYVVFKDGICMRFRPADLRSVPSVTLNNGSYEPRELRFLARLVVLGGTALDIGANTGFVALRLARAAGPEGRVIAFEPVLETYQELVQNVLLNQLERQIACERLGLGERSCEAEFYVPARQGSVAASGRRLFANEDYRSTRVELTTLDRFVVDRGLERLDLIKCDVEGAELFVLRGGQETLRRFRPILMLELLRKWARLYDYHPNVAIDLLRSLGYECGAFHQGHFLSFNTIEEDTEPTNFFFWHPAFHAELLAQALQGDP